MSYPIIHRYITPRYLTVNVFMVETPHGVVLIDGATALSTSREIRGIIEDEIKKPVLAVLMTHGHPDHYVGVGEIVKGLDVPIIATQGTLDFARYQDEEKFDTLIRRNYGDDAPAERVFPNQIVEDGDMVTLDGVEFHHIYLGPCESDADSVWVVEIEGAKHAFLGDIVYNHMHSYFRDGHALNWLRGLDRLLSIFDHTAVFHPAHGEPGGTELIHWQKAYITAFLDSVRAMLNAGKVDQEALVARMQSFLPNDKLIMLLKYKMDETIRILSEKLTGGGQMYGPDAVEKVVIGEGVTLQRLGGGEGISAVHWDLEDGSEVKRHSHPQEQFGYVIKGALAVTIGEETQTVPAGGWYFVPPNVPHGFVTVGETEAIDVFTPIRKV
jgi:glyoxylase-like metal-dependent hydrolase (beta-lactamase superfamily II)/quercetin dioxygenase-like cupin family protein